MSTESEFLNNHFEGVIAAFALVIGGLTTAIALFWRRFLKVDLMETRLTILEDKIDKELEKAERDHANIWQEIKELRTEATAIREDLAHIKGLLTKGK